MSIYTMPIGDAMRSVAATIEYWRGKDDPWTVAARSGSVAQFMDATGSATEMTAPPDLIALQNRIICNPTLLAE